MNVYICPRCGRRCYSAASYRNMTDKSCPYVGCDGQIEENADPDGNQKSAKENLTASIMTQQGKDVK